MSEPQFDRHEEQKATSRAVFVSLCYLGYDFLYIFIGRLHRAIHLGEIRYRIVMLDLESGAYLCHHVVIQVETIVRYNSL